MKRDEQNPTNKAEQKFKVGDLVVDNCGYVWKIEGTLNQFYILEGVEGGESRPTIEWANKTFHLWSIEDAKDGDVLAVEPIDDYQFPFIVIYENRGLNFFNSYCSMGFDGKFYEATTGHALDNLYPATKEQRDLLSQKMRESGYEFDFEKKELKKLSQRMISAEAKEALWSDKYEGLTDFERTLADICIGWIGEELGWKQYIKDNADVLLKIAIEKFNSVQDISFKQKPAWSEENEKILNNLIDYIKVDDALQYSEKQVVDWLKSLKNRVISQPDMIEALRTEYEKGRADTIAEMYVPTQISPEESLGVSSEKYMDIVDTLTQGGQKPAKWSLEDERTIAIINNALTESNTPPDDYDKVYDWLESIKQRIGWKPSNAQIEALEHFVRSIGESGYASPYDNNTKLLYSLLEQLKKLKA